MHPGLNLQDIMIMDNGEVVVSGWAKDRTNQKFSEENIIFDCGKVFFNMTYGK